MKDSDLRPEPMRSLELMLRIRIFESAVARLHDAGEIPGIVHLSIGQEAAIVGACTALASGDYMTGTHRSHGHPIAMGADVAPLMAEILGRSSGVCRGRGGSMHLADFSVGSLGESGIVASGLPVAAGAGLSAEMAEEGRVVLAFFGDGAVNEGAWHESINLAAVWSLPVIFFCENNGLAVSTPLSASTAGGSIAGRASAYGIEGAEVDGQDVDAVWRVVAKACRKARDGDGPTLIEADTCRFSGHAHGQSLPGDNGANSATDEGRRDPIAIWSQRILDRGWGTHEELEAIVGRIEHEIEAAVESGLSAAAPEPNELFEGTFADPPPAFLQEAERWLQEVART